MKSFVRFPCLIPMFFFEKDEFVTGIYRQPAFSENSTNCFYAHYNIWGWYNKLKLKTLERLTIKSEKLAFNKVDMSLP